MIRCCCFIVMCVSYVFNYPAASEIYTYCPTLSLHYALPIFDKPAPAFELIGAVENAVTLADFTDKIVVLHFVYASRPDFCPLHAEKLAEVQAKDRTSTRLKSSH